MANSEIGTSTGNTSGGKYQVFLNFCGQDTRAGFTSSLYRALVNAGITVFKDNEEIRQGEIFSSELLQAIDDSKLYITIFSPNYASRHWCLRELAKMMENISKHQEDGKKKVLFAIFYKVKPDDLKSKTGLYSKAISELEQQKKGQEKKFSIEEVTSWKLALDKADAFQGFELVKYEDEGHLIDSVVDEVAERLQTRQRRVPNDLVGMEDPIAAIKDLLDINSTGAQLIGIWGMGGIGKTTLAKTVYDQLCSLFTKNCSFVDDVSEKAKSQGLVQLQRQLLSDISNSRGVSHISNSDQGIDRIEGTIRNKKVLIVLDDVDDVNQTRELIGMDSLHHGTRILITTRDRAVLENVGLKCKIESYEMKGLGKQDALQLFCRHAFKDNSPPADFHTLSNQIVSTAGGLPLAVQAIGSSLFGKNKETWEEMRDDLRNRGHDDVLGKLRITYEKLKKGEREIFLDIACLFIGHDKTNPIYMWKDCGFSPWAAIGVLTERCMIKVLDDDTFRMHDMFRDLGRLIAEEEHSRLWVVRDIDDITRELSLTQDDERVQALNLGFWYLPLMTVTAKQIKRLRCLRYLRADNVTCQGDFMGCLSKLTWIELHCFTSQFMATNLHLEKVAVMILRGPGFTEDKFKSLIKGARKLKVLSLS